MSDREQAGFRGPVKTCVEESVFSNQGVSKTTTEFRPDGKLLGTRSDHGNGFAWVSAREYDSAGRLTSLALRGAGDCSPKGANLNLVLGTIRGA
jgi:hypothetical protein